MKTQIVIPNNSKVSEKQIKKNWQEVLTTESQMDKEPKKIEIKYDKNWQSSLSRYFQGLPLIVVTRNLMTWGVYTCQNSGVPTRVFFV